MSAWIPVIASDFPLWKEIVEGAECGICVDPHSPQEIARAVNTLLTDNELAAVMGANGRRAVEEVYNWQNEERKLLDLYQELIIRPRIYTDGRRYLYRTGLTGCIVFRVS